jgi:hypothetical protein
LGDVRLLTGDCREAMPANGPFDLLIIDPGMAEKARRRLAANLFGTGGPTEPTTTNWKDETP